MKAIDKLKELTGHENVLLVNSGNGAIFLALLLAKEKHNQIYIPDQGGWLSYQTFPKLLSLKAFEIKTDHGLINPNQLDAKEGALIAQSMAGYFAEQSINEIQKKFFKNNCLFIQDASPNLGEKLVKTDITVGSFGKWKPVELGYGGFISSDMELEFDKQLLKMLKFQGDQELLLRKIDQAPERITSWKQTQSKIKKDLKSFNIIHKDIPGSNVIVKFDNESEKEEIIKYCTTNKYEYTICPRYIWVLDNAISIEVKRLR